MGSLTAVQQSEVDVPVAAVFAYVDDWRNVHHWLVGVEQFTPVGDRDRGLGSVFDAVVHAGIKVRTRLEVTDYVPDRLIQFDSVKGLKVRNRWHFESLDDGRTLVRAESQVQPPFGPAGKAMAKVLEPAIKKLMERSAAQLRARLEAV